ncbi:P-loop NTPase fold protein [Porphyromonas endodontalis]|uniref:KAP family P-loop NTPase fold protein n=1 Tax=Porphyromonas endodontalis TaxID=28124 RepID=UPI0028E70E47|nr:P-loop NTPase fold protein [Porphyromonas endodontalis]
MEIEKDMLGSFKEKVVRLVEFIKKNHLHWYLCIILFVVYCFCSYEDPILQWYDEHIIDRYLSKVTSNIALQVLTALLMIIVGHDIYRKIINRYHYDERFIFFIFLLLVVVLQYRFCQLYEYLPWLGIVSYMDVFLLIGASYIVSSVVNLIRRERVHKKNSREGSDQKASSCTVLHDCPITSKDKDIFDFQNDISKIEAIISELDRHKTWSLAITAQWGAGKTSFMNLVIEKLRENRRELEIIYFNPRASKSIDTIQTDFFSRLTGILSKYDSRCSSTMKNYMSSLQLIDNRGVIEKAVSFYRIWNKENLRERIKKTIGSIQKRVLVIIDDFDRLSKEEILEVLKLIDNNAVFPNLIFLTAYDKGQLNKHFEENSSSSDAHFVDKFFNLEFLVPQRPYVYISRFIEDELCEKLDSETERENFGRVLSDRVDKFQAYLPTLRDAKRFINQFLQDYKLVQGDVIIEEFLLIQLIKYKYPDEYKRIYKKDFVYKNESRNPDVLYLIEKEEVGINAFPILELLFLQGDEPIKNTFRHIFSVYSFENYFVNQIFGLPRVEDMEKIFDNTEEMAISTVDSCLEEKAKLSHFVDYLKTRDLGCLSKDQYFRYVMIVAYVAGKRPKDRELSIFLTLISIPNVERHCEKYGLDIESYKEIIVKIISNEKYDNNLSLLRRLHTYYKIGDLNEKDYLLKDADVWLKMKEEFLKRIRGDERESSLIRCLYDCIDYMEGPFRKPILDKDCLDAGRDYITRNPNYYIEHFVRLVVSSNLDEVGSVGCDRFWKQIFGNEDRFLSFVEKCMEDNIPRAKRVSNFWRLYKANDIKPIEFNSQGNVQEKIDSDLCKEVEMLEKIEEIQRQVKKISNSNPDQKLCEKLLSDLDKIKLNISLARKVKEEIWSLMGY